MNIEQMAREAGAEAWDVWRDADGKLCVTMEGWALTEELERFAALVRDQALDEAAAVCRDGARIPIPDVLDGPVTMRGCAIISEPDHDLERAILALKQPQG